jgi:hypothetical protein
MNTFGPFVEALGKFAVLIGAVLALFWLFGAFD